MTPTQADDGAPRDAPHGGGPPSPPEQGRGPLRILLLCEGNAETHDSWSGISRSITTALRDAGHTVVTADCDLYGVRRVLALLATWSPRRFRWWVRYHLGGLPFRLRSGRAAHHIRVHRREVDVILQVGATFSPQGHGSVPYLIYCDSNARLAERGRALGHSEVSALTPKELDAVVERERRVYREASGIMTFSERLRESFIEDFSIPAERVHTVFAGPNFSVEDIPFPRDLPSWDTPTVLFVGRRFERKGGDLLLRAFGRVREVLPAARLLIVGPPDLQVDQEGVTNLGFLDRDDPAQAERLRAAYESAHLFCMPTRFEAFGLVYLEAMLFSLPCIGPDAWAVPEIVTDQVTGLITPPEEVDALAAAMLDLLRDPERCGRMGRAGRDRAVRSFTWPSVADRVAQCLSNAQAVEIPS